MKQCRECGVAIATPAVRCPLCGAPLQQGPGGEKPAYPKFVESRKRYYFVRRLLLFLSILSAFVCILVNLLATPEFWWWPFVVTGLVYVWCAVPHIFRKGGNLGGKLLMQVVCASALFVALDFETQWRGWSVTFALPLVFCAGIIGVLILILCNRTNWAVYVLYQVTLAAFGFIPLCLYLAGVSTSLLTALLPTCLAAASLAMLAAFGDRSIKNEFKRRLHF